MRDPRARWPAPIAASSTTFAPAEGVIIAKWLLPMIGSGDFAAFELAPFTSTDQTFQVTLSSSQVQFGEVHV